MSNRAWMPLHIADYLSDTGHLNAAEHGAYLLLIMHYWQNGHLPQNEKLIARVARMTVDQWEESRDVIAMLFGPNWTHKRIDAELSKADDIIEKRRAAAESRYSKPKKKPSDANAMHVQSKSTYTRVPPLTDNLTASASNEASAGAALDPTILESKMREAAGDKIQPSGGFVVGPILELILAGADVDLDVLPAIRSTASKLTRPARSWAYFVPAIQDAFDRRRSAGTWERAQPPPGQRQSLTPHQQRHQAALKAFDRKLGIINDDEFTGNTLDLESRDIRSH